MLLPSHCDLKRGPVEALAILKVNKHFVCNITVMLEL